eukprot:CAMPEP_0174265416 /NCGR_PEP_ID=MMETSP0439-20130205/26392_1 /TAXON_ID=0 /ORGANISM="Stereomyxa ramosa, Strain Chinc5" /LENGTH=529 /DNA_ID=CAMNT_0015351855 /DNA_START=9 /DNA_END=1594 /DNA_ORIENTATION=-
MTSLMSSSGEKQLMTNTIDDTHSGNNYTLDAPNHTNHNASHNSPVGSYQLHNNSLSDCQCCNLKNSSAVNGSCEYSFVEIKESKQHRLKLKGKREEKKEQPMEEKEQQEKKELPKEEKEDKEIKEQPKAEKEKTKEGKEHTEKGNKFQTKKEPNNTETNGSKEKTTEKETGLRTKKEPPNEETQPSEREDTKTEKEEFEKNKEKGKEKGKEKQENLKVQFEVINEYPEDSDFSNRSLESTNNGNGHNNYNNNSFENIVEKSLLILDARPKLNAGASMVTGGGYEKMKSYPFAKRTFLGIENIHVMRNSLLEVQKWVLTSFTPGEPELSEEEQTKSISELQWFRQISRMLEGASKISSKLHKGIYTCVVVHCSDGWDRTPALCSLMQMMMDGYYRTINGLQVLIEKDWLAYGHRFHSRCGHVVIKKRANEIYEGDEPVSDNEISPIFFQFLDCIFQLLRKYPKKFEFNEALLLLLADSLYSCFYGTFLCDSDFERIDKEIELRTFSIWHTVSKNISKYKNKNYKPKPQPS